MDGCLLRGGHLEGCKRRGSRACVCQCVFRRRRLERGRRHACLADECKRFCRCRDWCSGRRPTGAGATASASPSDTPRPVPRRLQWPDRRRGMCRWCSFCRVGGRALASTTMCERRAPGLGECGRLGRPPDLCRRCDRPSMGVCGAFFVSAAAGSATPASGAWPAGAILLGYGQRGR